MAVKLSMRCKGDFEKIRARLESMKRPPSMRAIFDKYGKLGVEALSKATPVRTGLTAASWYYEIVEGDGTMSIVWKNSNRKQYERPGKRKPGMRTISVPIALVIYYGHGTPTGGYVEGIDYINPAVGPVMEELKSKLLRHFKEVTVK